MDYGVNITLLYKNNYVITLKLHMTDHTLNGTKGYKVPGNVA
jgi:hypothetical protein